MATETVSIGRSWKIVVGYLAVALAGAGIAWKGWLIKGLYVWLSVATVVAVYLWGVGKWSRVEPRQLPLKTFGAAPPKSDVAPSTQLGTPPKERS